MLVHKFCTGNKPIMVLIHGFLTPWQIWMPQISAFENDYDIFVIALNAHTEENTSEFVSVSEEAKNIVRYLKENNIFSIDVLCGISLGGAIAFKIWKCAELNIRHIIMDGAPLVPCPKIAVNIMINNYKNIIHKSQKRDSKVLENFKKNFLPEKYLENYLHIADLMTDTSIENIVHSVFSCKIVKNIENESKILFIYGTKANEFLSKKSAKLMKKYYPTTETVCFKGDTHCYKVIYQPQKWIETVTSFLKNG